MSNNLKTIWCLFSVANDYNQPNNNLEAWWSEKPSTKSLADVLSTTTAIADSILAGNEVRLGDVDYRISYESASP